MAMFISTECYNNFVQVVYINARCVIPRSYSNRKNAVLVDLSDYVYLLCDCLNRNVKICKESYSVFLPVNGGNRESKSRCPWRFW